MNRDEIFARLKAFLETDFPNEGEELRGDTDLLDEWFVDSLAIVEVVLFVESNFGVTVARRDISGENFADLNVLSDFVVSRMNL